MNEKLWHPTYRLSNRISNFALCKVCRQSVIIILIDLIISIIISIY